jgi:hypothetical protein
MEANLLSANAEPRQLTADEMDLVSGGMVIIMPWVRIAITQCGWEANVGDRKVSSSDEWDLDSPLPR